MRGFTLIELSVVLTIFALLAGGIVAGKSVMDAAKLNHVIGEYQRYSQAVNQFQEKYGELPGDLSRATEIWGAASTVSPTACALTDSTGQKTTCNGNGDGIIFTSVPCPLWTESWCYSEQHRSLQHLANAGLIEGNFSGKSAFTQSWHRAGGINAAKGPYDSTVLFISHYTATPGSSDYFARSVSSNVFGFSTFVSGATNPSRNAVLLPAQIFWKIDTKIDDGRPGTGEIFSLPRDSTWHDQCTTDNNFSTAQYNISSSAPRCAFLYFTLRN